MAQDRDSAGYKLSQKMRVLEKKCPPEIIEWIKTELRPSIEYLTTKVKRMSQERAIAPRAEQTNTSLLREIAHLKKELRELRDPIQKRASIIKQARIEYKHEKEKIKDAFGI
jgi:molecular chaperone GrpE (heat shock protein)